MDQVCAHILSNEELMPKIYLLWVEAPGIAGGARPGQFVTVRCGEGYDPLLRRPFSIHRVAGGRKTQRSRIALLYAVRGRGTRWLASRVEGDVIDVLGPLGRGFSVQRASRNLLLVAGGMGIAPLAFLADEAIAADRSVSLLIGSATASGIYPSHLLPPEVELAITTEDGSAGRKGLVSELVPDLLPWADQVFACGPMPMYHAIAAVSYRLLPGKSIQVLLEVPMACGMGVCYGCSLETKRGPRLVCKDGPRFELTEVV